MTCLVSGFICWIPLQVAGPLAFQGKRAASGNLGRGGSIFLGEFAMPQTLRACHVNKVLVAAWLSICRPAGVGSFMDDLKKNLQPAQLGHVGGPALPAAAHTVQQSSNRPYA